jgi:hypothetical protein
MKTLDENLFIQILLTMNDDAPENATECRTRGTRLDYFKMHTCGRR